MEIENDEKKPEEEKCSSESMTEAEAGITEFLSPENPRIQRHRQAPIFRFQRPRNRLGRKRYPPGRPRATRRPQESRIQQLRQVLRPGTRKQETDFRFILDENDPNVEEVSG